MTTVFRPRVLSLALCALGLAGVAGSAAAETAATFPSKPITIIVQFGAGGPTDLPPRQIASYLEKKFKQPVIVENRTGGAGVIGISAIARAAPDGYTIGTFTSGPTIIAPKLRAVPYDPRKDFTMVAQIAEFSIPVCVLPSQPWKTFDDLVTQARQKPGSVTYSTVGSGSGANIFMETVGKTAGVKFTHVPFSGGAGGIAALLGGHVSASLDAALGKQASTGECRALATMGSARLPALPNVPTFKELGFVKAEPALWLGLVGPAGMPADIVKKLSDAILEATRQPEYAALLKQLLLNEKTGSAEQFKATVAADDASMEAVINELGLAKK
jgi:tripartite-type tricarboxylate transporter receptor subunit TctC